VTLEGTLTDLLRHMQWADALVWAAVLSSPEATHDADLRDRLYHVHVTQHAFLHVWLGIEGDLHPEGFQDSVALARWARAYYARVPSYASQMTPAGLGDSVPESLLQAAAERLGTGAGTPTMGETVVQVVTHSLHHRGQICTRLRALGVEPPLTEYFVWVWAGKPEAHWPPATP
jgi:uncharacterized damage-inducible protein DinB